MSSSPFARIIEAFPIWEIRSKSDFPTNLALANGNSVQFGARAIRKISANDIHQIPSFTDFELITPNLNDLISFGIITRTPATTPASPSAQAKANSTSSKE